MCALTPQHGGKGFHYPSFTAVRDNGAYPTFQHQEERTPPPFWEKMSNGGMLLRKLFFRFLKRELSTQFLRSKRILVGPKGHLLFPKGCARNAKRRLSLAKWIKRGLEMGRDLDQMDCFRTDSPCSDPSNRVQMDCFRTDSPCSDPSNRVQIDCFRA